MSKKTIKSTKLKNYLFFDDKLMQMSNKIGRLKREIKKIIERSPIATDPAHAVQVLKFVLEMKPHASEELQIAALAHDIERGVAPRSRSNEGESYESYKKRHAKRSARITVEILQNHGYSKTSIDKVRKLIEIHEEGGSKEADILRDADSISYFDTNIDYYLELYGSKKTQDKIKFMYERASKRAKERINKLEFSKEAQKLMKEVI